MREICLLNIIQFICILSYEYSVYANLKVSVRTVFHLLFSFLLPSPFTLWREQRQSEVFIFSLTKTPLKHSRFCQFFWMPLRKSLASTTVSGHKIHFLRELQIIWNSHRIPDSSSSPILQPSSILHSDILTEASFRFQDFSKRYAVNFLGYILRSQD